MVQINAAADAAGVDFRTINIGARRRRAAAPARGAPTHADARRPRAPTTVGTAGFSTMPFTFDFKGSFFELGKFFNRLDRFVAVRNGGLDVTGRLMLLNSITLTPDTTKGFPMLTRRREREQLPAAAHRGPDRRRDRRRPDRRGRRARRARDPGAERPRHDHDRDHLWSHPMSVLNDTWRFLVQRRLWPVAILLIAAAAAVPMLLAQDPAPAPAAAPAVAVKADKDAVLAEDPIVAQAADGDRSGRRQVLGSPKNPFKPQGHPDPDARSRRRRDGGPAPAATGARPATGAATPTRGRLARAGRHPRPGPQEEEVRALRADRALRRLRRRPARAQATSSACRPCRPTSNPC